MVFWRRGRALGPALAAALVGAGGGCGRGEGAGGEPGAATATAAAAAKPRGKAGVELVAAPSSDEPADAVVRREAERARGAGRTLVVYLGAPWCEPCVRFHDAARAGALDADLPSLTLLEFDHDRDADKLRAAGYDWRFVPLFARPGADGRASGRSIEGAVKGEGAVAYILPRLRGLLTP